MPSLTLTHADQGKSLTVSPGDTVSLTLDEAPTTGYRWDIERSNAEILEVLDSTYRQPGQSAVGGSGEHSWTFKAKREGSVQLVLKRWRSFEGDTSVVERFDVTIRVAN
jgi:inhibitor of cysteine peptidase